LGWFALQAAVALWHTVRTLSADNLPELIGIVATWQAPLRDLQVHGLALFMILGVSLRLLPAWFGTPVTPARRAWWGYGV